MITILARLKAKPGKETELEQVCVKLAEEVRAAEKGCLMYIAHASPKNKGEIVFMEKYQDEQAVESHRQSAHFIEASKRFKDILASSPQIEILTEVQ